MPNSEQTLLYVFAFKIDGADIPQEMMDNVLECLVDQSINIPDLCTVRIADERFEFLDSSLLAAGKRLEVSAGEQGGTMTKVFDGEIVGLEVDMSAHGTPCVVVRAYNKLHRLHRGRVRKTYVDVTLSDIAQQIASRNGLSAEVESTSPVHKWIIQNNQTDFEFLVQIAFESGHEFAVDGSKLLFKKAVPTSGPTIELSWGQTLADFRPRLTAVEQVKKVTVRGWDPTRKEAILGQATSTTTHPRVGLGKDGGTYAEQAFGGQKEFSVVTAPVTTQPEADTRAKSILDEINGSFIEASGLCDGRAEIKAGGYVKITNIGTRFSGEYYVTHATHVYTAGEGYTTRFTVTGKRPSSLVALLDSTSEERHAPLGGNVVIGIVTDVRDTEQDYGHVKVKFPWLHESENSHWMRLAAPMAGPERGMYFMPEVNDEVLVAFEHGDMRRGYIIGALWNGRDKPPRPISEVVKDGAVKKRIIKTTYGHILEFNDGSDPSGPFIHVTTKNSNQIKIDDKDNKIHAATQKGHCITIDDASDSITVKNSAGTAKVTIDCGGASMKFECTGDFVVDTKGQFKVDAAAGVQVKTPATMNLEATGTGTLKSTGPLTVQSSAILTVQGSLVKIN